MSRNQIVTVRFTEEEMNALLEQMEKESEKPGTSGEGFPAAMKGRLKEDTVSSYIRRKCLAKDASAELQRIRMILTRIETALSQISLYLKRNPKTGLPNYAGSSFTALKEELRMVKTMFERMLDNGGNGTETH